MFSFVIIFAVICRFFAGEFCLNDSFLALRMRLADFQPNIASCFKIARATKSNVVGLLLNDMPCGACCSGLADMVVGRILALQQGMMGNIRRSSLGLVYDAGWIK